MAAVQNTRIPPTKENQQGEQALPEQEKFAHWSAKANLKHIMDCHDDDTGKHMDSDHQWLFVWEKSTSVSQIVVTRMSMSFH